MLSVALMLKLVVRVTVIEVAAGGKAAALSTAEFVAVILAARLLGYCIRFDVFTSVTMKNGIF
jgi:hypothetical protein